MKLHSILLLSTAILMACCPVSNGQYSNAPDPTKILVLKHRYLDKTRFMNQGEVIKIWTGSHMVIKGSFKIINDSVIQMKGRNIHLSDIVKIKINNSSNKAAGIVLIAAGAFGVLAGTIVAAGEAAQQTLHTLYSGTISEEKSHTGATLAAVG